MTEMDPSADDRGTALDEQGVSEWGNARSVFELLTKLARRKRLIAIVTGISIMAGLIVSFALPARYTAVARIMPPKQTQSTTTFLNSTVGMGSLAEAASGAAGLRDPNAIYIGLLKSRAISDSIITRFGLGKAYRAKDMTEARKELEKNTQILSEKSTMIAISVTDKDKNRSADIANAYIDGLRQLSKSVSVTEAAKRRRFFEEQVNSQRESLVAAEDTFQEVQQSKGLVHLDAQANVIIGSLAGIRSQIAAKKVELNGLQSYSTERNPDVQLAEREISTMEQEASELEQHSGTSGFSELGLKDVPGAGLDYLRAQRELQYQQSLFDLLLRQFEAARLDEAKEAAVIQVVEPAIPPDQKSWPHRLTMTLIFSALGFFGVCAYVLLCEVARSNPNISQSFADFKSALVLK